MATSGKFWNKRRPADMHGDGVHFDKEQLAEKEAKRHNKESVEKKEFEKEEDMNINSKDERKN